MCCVLVLYSGPHLDSSAVCWPWTQILLSGEQIWLVSMNYISDTDTKYLTVTEKKFVTIYFFQLATLLTSLLLAILED